MQSITAAISSLSHTIKKSMQPTPPPPSYTLDDVIALEETERERRMHQSTAQEDQANAGKVSSLVHGLRLPYFNGTSAGFKRLTRRAEEQERSRRMMTKPELALRKSNANLSAGMIRAIGYPFFQQDVQQAGPQYVLVSETSLLAEQERLDRINNPLQVQLAKNNAALVANALRWGWSGMPLGSFRFTRALEEKERARRLTDRDELALAAEGAYRQAGLIRNIGGSFYVQNEHVDTVTLEEQEKARRLSDKNEQVLARQHASIVSRLLPIWASGKSNARAEQERKRRMSDVEGQQHAREIARQLSDIVSAGNNMDEVLEHERQRRIKHAEHDRAIAHQVADLIEGLRFSKSNAHDLYEKEARRRLRDVTGERIARQNANKIAALVSARPNWGEETPSIETVEEAERKQRMYDWPTQQMHMRNARKASDMIKAAKVGRKQSPSFQTEKERHRRMVDAGLQAIALENAKKVSQMVLNNAQPLRSVPVSAIPATVIPVNTMPTAAPVPVPSFPEASLPRDLPTDFMPPAETMREALPFHSELLQTRPVAPPAVLPFKNELLQRQPEQMPALPQHSALPFAQELLEKRPVAPFADESVERGLPQQQSLPFASQLLEKTPVATPAVESELLQTQPVMASAPVSNIPTPSAPLAEALSPLAQQPAFVPQQQQQQAFPQLSSAAPLVQQPLSMNNPFSAQAQQPMMMQQQPAFVPAPISATQAPVMPIAQPSTPLAAYPQLSRSVQPFAQQQPMSSAPFSQQLPYTTAPTMTSSAPLFPAGAVMQPSFYSAAGTHAMTDAQRKRLEKQALKHNKRASRDNKKAENLIQKAEKLHARGKESRALKKENKAEQKVISSKQHALWANDLLAKNGSSIQAPIAQQPHVFMPAM